MRKRLPSAAVRRGTSAHESIRGGETLCGGEALSYQQSRGCARDFSRPACTPVVLRKPDRGESNEIPLHRTRRAAVPIAAAALLAADARLGHWPQWRGPAKDGM